MLKSHKMVSRFIVLILMFSANVSFANDKIWKKLAKGGYVVVMRHAPVVKGSAAASPLVRDSGCKKERMLSSKGKAAAKIIGERFKKHKIPITNVFHSPYCRTFDTATIAFGQVQVKKYLSLLEVLSSSESTIQTERLNKVIGSYVGKSNLVLVTHRPNISAISFEQARHLDFIVLKPKGTNKYDEIGIVRFIK